MPHDIDGTRLAVGDTVLVACKVKAIHDTEDYCNVDLETVQHMPSPGSGPVAITLNAKQVRQYKHVPGRG